MDKKDFYKEIMSQYTFDKEKVRRNAKRSSSASFIERHGRWLPLSTAAAVFVAVFGGYMLLSPVLNRSGELIPDSTYLTGAPSPLSQSDDDSLTAGQRLERMERLISLYNSNKLGSETKVMYVTFNEPMTYPEFNLNINSNISDTGIIRIESVYNGEFVNGAGYASDSKTLFSAAKIHAPEYLYVKLTEVFAFVDYDDMVTDENFEPFSGNSVNEQSLVQITEPAVSTAENIQMNASVTETPPGTTTTAPVTEPAVSQTTAVSETTTQTADDTLPPLEVSAIIRIPADGVSDVEFIDDDHFIMLFKNKVALFRIIEKNGKSDYEQITSFDVNDPEITYTCKTSKTFVILGSDASNRRSRLFIADGINGTLTEADVSPITPDASITYAFCNGNRILLKTQSLETSSLYYATKDSSGKFRLDMLQNTSKTTVVNFDDTSFVYTIKGINENGGEITELFDYSFNDFTSYELSINADLTDSISYIRSSDLSNFAINSNDTGEAWIWNAKLGELSVKLDANVMKFSDYNSNVFTDGVNWYRLEGLEVEVISEAEASSLSVKPDFSNMYTVYEVTSDMVKIETK